MHALGSASKELESDYSLDYLGTSPLPHLCLAARERVANRSADSEPVTARHTCYQLYRLQ